MDLVLKTAAVIPVTMLLLALAKNRSAATKHRIIASMMGALVLIPILAGVGPQWGEGWISSPVIWHKAAATDAREPSCENRRYETGWLDLDGVALYGIGAIDVSSSKIMADHTRDQHGGERNTMTPFLIVSWGAGIFLCLLSLSRGLFRASRLARGGKPLTKPFWLRLLTRCHRLLHIRRQVLLKENPAIGVPITVGVIKPVVILPAQAETWSFHRRGSVLIHELAHIKRGDPLVSLIACLACALNWYNPLVWWLWKKMKLYREQACDEMVLRSGVRASSYAEHLLELGKDVARAKISMQMVMSMANGSLLRIRLLSILNTNLSKKEKQMDKKRKISWLVAWLLGIGLLGTMQIFTLDKGLDPAAESERIDSRLHTPGAFPFLAEEEEGLEMALGEKPEKKEKQKSVIKISKDECDTIAIKGDTLILKKDGATIRRVILSPSSEAEVRLDSETYRIKILKGNMIVKKVDGGGESVLWHGDDHFTLIKGEDIAVIGDKLLIKTGDADKHVMILSVDGEDNWGIYKLDDESGLISLKKTADKGKIIALEGTDGHRLLSVFDEDSQDLTDIYIKEGGGPGEIRIHLTADKELSRKDRHEVEMGIAALKRKIPDFVDIESKVDSKQLDITIRVHHGDVDQSVQEKAMKMVNIFIRSLKGIVSNITMNLTLHSGADEAP